MTRFNPNFSREMCLITLKYKIISGENLGRKRAIGVHRVKIAHMGPMWVPYGLNGKTYLGHFYIGSRTNAKSTKLKSSKCV